MKKIMLIVLLFVFSLSVPVYAAWDQKDVQKILDKIQAGKGFQEVGAYPQDQIQIVDFSISSGLVYEIDVKAKLCFVLFYPPGRGGASASLIPCKNLKDGYPLIAPLINWEK